MKKVNRTLAVWTSIGLVGSAWAAPFSLFAAESAAGSNGNNTALYGAVRQYGFSGTGGVANSGPGLPATALNDPVGLAFRNGKLYIGNRHGNTLGLGSVQSADWNGTVLSNVTTVATQTQSSEQGFHGIGFAPNGDLFATTVNDGTIRYRNSGSGYVKIGKTTSGAVRDAWISPDGKKLFETTTGSVIRVTDLTAGGFGSFADFNVAGASAMHQMAWANGALFVTSFNTSRVFRVTLDSGFVPTGSSEVANVAGAIGVAFSPDGNEMFVSRHSVGGISRLSWNGSSWADSGLIQTGTSMGYLQTVPEPASILAVGAGLAVALRRRRPR
ncbi:MAG: PEP-CTERM sorting domain-containing protein [Chthonomonas sp.]|nr:PEP-CTERM sorting domain-containing protein [Chthonomonas sp.]